MHVTGDKENTVPTFLGSAQLLKISLVVTWETFR